MALNGFSYEDEITKNLKAMVTRANAVSSYLNRNLFKQYQKAQAERFESENQSQQGQWDSLNPTYAVRKKKMAAKLGWAGGGGHIMIASGKLKDGATARDTALFLKTVTNTSFTISINTGTIPYAIYPGKQRPFMEFTDSTEERWSQGITDYIAGKAGGA